jgi:putative membrane protein insertion efficiency factor
MRGFLSDMATLSLLLPVRFYQVVISPLMPQVCRFYPSCSEYFVLAVHKHGPLRGACKGVWRVCRCNPFNHGGYDPP